MTGGRVALDVDVPMELAMLDQIGQERMGDAIRSRFQRVLVVGDLNADRWRS